MTTKTIEKTIVEKTTIYVSADGKEWENKADCEAWERGIQCVATESWKRIPKVQINTVECGLEYSNEDEEAYIVTPRDHNDIVALENYVRVYTCESYGFDDSFIGKPTIVNFGYDHDFCSAVTVEQHIENIQRYLSNKIDNIK